MLIDWGKLVSQGRAKAPGISWSNEEGEAVALLAQTFNKSMAEVAPYVRKGILTVEEYKKAKDEPEIVHPYLKLSKDKLIKKAQSLKISASPDVTKEVLVEAILEKEEKDKKEAEAKKKADEEAKIKEKTEAEAKAKAKAVPKAKPKAPVKKKPASKPKAKPSKKKGKR